MLQYLHGTSMQTIRYSQDSSQDRGEVSLLPKAIILGCKGVTWCQLTGSQQPKTYIYHPKLIVSLSCSIHNTLSSSVNHRTLPIGYGPTIAYTMSRIQSHLITLKNGDNFHDWQYQLQGALLTKKLWSIINGTKQRPTPPAIKTIIDTPPNHMLPPPQEGKDPAAHMAEQALLNQQN